MRTCRRGTFQTDLRKLDRPLVEALWTKIKTGASAGPVRQMSSCFIRVKLARRFVGALVRYCVLGA